MPTLATIDPGTLFKADGVYAVKSEYFYSSGQCECVLIASGEYAYFSQQNETPVEVVDLAAFFNDLARASLEIDELRNALEAQSRAYALQRGALVEAEQALSRGQLLDAQAAIRRGLGQ